MIKELVKLGCEYINPESFKDFELEKYKKFSTILRDIKQTIDNKLINKLEAVICKDIVMDYIKLF